MRFASRGALAAASVIAVASCEVLAPLDGLVGDAGSSSSDGTLAPDTSRGNDGSSSSGGSSSGGSSSGGGSGGSSSGGGSDGSGADDATGDTGSGDSGSAGSDAADAVAADATGDAASGADVSPPTDAAADASDGALDAPTSTYAAAVLLDAPLGYWRLGESSGTVAHDASGHGNDGTYTGAVVLGAPGALKKDSDTAALFDGVTGNVDVGNKFDFAGQVPFSFEAWVEPTVIDANYRHVVTKMAFDVNKNPHEGTYVLVHQGTTLGFERWSAGAPVLVSATSALGGVGTWSHVVTTYDGSTATIFVNGVPATTAASTGGVAANTVHMLWGDLFQGYLDELAVYDHALATARVLAHYQAAQ
jgi:hypothetical protein